jgi:hypothetical protein
MKQIIAAKAVRISRNAELLKLAMTPKSGTTTAPERSSNPPCFTPFRRAEMGTGSSGER